MKFERSTTHVGTGLRDNQASIWVCRQGSRTRWSTLLTAGNSRSECATVTPSRFRGSGLTTCALRGADFLGYADESDSDRRVELTVQAALSGPRSVVYLYDRDLDHVVRRLLGRDHLDQDAGPHDDLDDRVGLVHLVEVDGVDAEAPRARATAVHDDRGDREIVVSSGWERPANMSGGLDAFGIAFDPAGTLYNSTMYLMAGLLAMALIANSLIRPVHERHAMDDSSERGSE